MTIGKRGGQRHNSPSNFSTDSPDDDRQDSGQRHNSPSIFSTHSPDDDRQDGCQLHSQEEEGLPQVRPPCRHRYARGQ